MVIFQQLKPLEDWYKKYRRSGDKSVGKLDMLPENTWMEGNFGSFDQEKCGGQPGKIRRQSEKLGL